MQVCVHPVFWTLVAALSSCLLIECPLFSGQSFAQSPVPVEQIDSPVEKSEVVPLLHDYDEAIATAEKLDRPILVVLGAEWCGPCKQLEKELAQPSFEAIFRKWIVVKIDIDVEVALAKEWQVSAVPAFRVLDMNQQVSASNEGFGGLRKLQSWLEENFDAANPKAQKLLRDDQPIDSNRIAELIKMLRGKRPNSRKLVMEMLSKHIAFSAETVIDTLSAGNLSQKLGALEILEKWSAPIAGLDPWAPDTISSERLERLRRWLSGEGRSLSAEQD
jgi:thiol-disulfide isomerase/thioredoxin